MKATFPHLGLGILVTTWGLTAGCATSPATSSTPVTDRAPLQDDCLDHLVGDWRITRSIRGTTAENTMEARWVLAHQFVQMHRIDVKRPPAYEAIVLIGYDAEKKRYIAHWCDTFGGAYSGDGFGIRAGNAVEFRFDYADGPFFNTFTWHRASSTWTFRGENGAADGSRKLFMEDAARRQ
jgi:hypothetical protein